MRHEELAHNLGLEEVIFRNIINLINLINLISIININNIISIPITANNNPNHNNIKSCTLLSHPMLDSHPRVPMQVNGQELS